MSTMRRAFRMSAGLAVAAVAALSFGAFAADPVSKDEAGGHGEEGRGGHQG